MSTIYQTKMHFIPYYCSFPTKMHFSLKNTLFITFNQISIF